MRKLFRGIKKSRSTHDAPARILAAILFGVMSFSPLVQAAQRLIDKEYPASGIKIVMTGSYDALPHAGHAPVQLEIHNRSQSDLEWQVSLAGSYSGRGSHLQTTCQVKAGQIGKFQFSAPLTLRAWSDRPQLQITMEGPGIGSYNTSYSSQEFSTGRRSSRDSKPFFLMSRQLARQSWSQLESDTQKHHLRVNGSPVGVKEFSSDYRDWLGVSHCFITPSEVNQLTGSQRAALETWLSQGGRLILCSEEEQLDPLLTIPNATEQATGFYLGAGRIEHVLLQEKQIPWKDFREQMNIADERLLPASLIQGYGAGSWLADGIQPPGLNEGWLMGIALLFAIAVAPVNLIWLARKRRRHWIFATVPMLSVAASLVLVATILAGDGLGGQGNRFTLVLHQPNRAEKLLINEQHSVTGLLVGSRFQTEPNVAMLPSPNAMGIHTRDLANQPEYRMSSNRQGERWDQWYASRSLRGYLVTESRPSREKVTITQENGIFKALSQNEAIFLVFYYVTPNGDIYHGTNLRTGIPEKLVPVAQKQFRQWHGEQQAAAGPWASQVIGQMPEADMFFAEAEPGASNRTETIDSIQYNNQVLVIGRVEP